MSLTEGQLAIRLADATPLIIADLVCLSMIAFLTTRLWVAAAPALGRRVGRWSLAITLPLGLAVSVIAHAWVPQRASELSEALDATACFVAIPLGLWWVGALLVTWTRRLLRRQRVAVPAPRRSDWLRMGMATLPVVGLAVLIQWGVSREETKDLNTRSDELRRMLRALEAVAVKHEEFFQERTRLDKHLENVHRIVPRAPDVEAFMVDLKPLAREQRIEMLGWTAGVNTTVGALQQHSVTLEVGGETRNLSGLAARSGKLVRLSSWHGARARDGKALVQLTVYSSPDKTAKAHGDACAHPSSDVWLWPYSVKVAGARAQVDRVCAAIKRLSVIQGQVDEYQAARAQLEGLLEGIKAVRSNRGEFQVIEEPQPSEDRVRATPPRKET